MVKLHIKKGDESQFLYETTVDVGTSDLIDSLVAIYNGRLKVQRICSEIEELADHGITLPPNMQGLTDEQIEELKLKDEWADKCYPSGGHIDNKDDIGRRNGIAPTEQMKEVLKKTCKEAKDMISKKKVDANDCTSQPIVVEALQILKGAVTIVYPMGLPPHDPIRAELENTEDLSGTQAALEVIEAEKASLYWAGKELERGKKLGDYIGKNEKTKIVCKLQKGKGVPAREPVVSEAEQKAMMAHWYRKQEDYKKMEENQDETNEDPCWADNTVLKKQLHGIGSKVTFPKTKF